MGEKGGICECGFALLPNSVFGSIVFYHMQSNMTLGVFVLLFETLVFAQFSNVIAQGIYWLILFLPNVCYYLISVMPEMPFSFYCTLDGIA